MKKRRGISLVEVVVAVLLISLMAGFMMRSIRNSVSLMAKAKDITTDGYGMMQNAENEIESVRAGLGDGTLTAAGDGTSYTLFRGTANETDVTGFPRRVDSSQVSYFKLNFVVGLETVEPLPTPAIDYLNILFDGAGAGVLSDPNVAYYFSGAKIVSDYNISTPPGISISEGPTTFRWYVSNPGFNIPPDASRSELTSAPLPQFPGDYSLITTQGVSNDTLNSLAERYAGRHIVLVAVPSSGTTGKMGTEEVSNTVFIPGLPQTASDKLLWHLDASVNVDIDTDPPYFSVDGWTDLSGNGYTYSPAPSSLPDGLPISWTTFGEDDDIYSRYVAFNSSGASILTPSQWNMNASTSTARSAVTVFAVARADALANAAAYTSDPILSAGDTGNVLAPKFSLYLDRAVYWKNTGTYQTASIPSVTENEWYVVGMTIKGGELRFSINGAVEETVSDANIGVGNIDLNTLNLGYGAFTTETSDLDVAEYLLYGSALSDTEFNDIMSYLVDKYGIS